MKGKEKFESIQFRMFTVMCLSTVMIIISLILINNIVLETFYKYSKAEIAGEIRDNINKYYNEPIKYDIKEDLKQLEIKNDMDICIEDSSNNVVYIGDKSMMSVINKVQKTHEAKTIYRKNEYELKSVEMTNDNRNILLVSKLDNGFSLYIKIPITPIKESVRISNRTLILIGFIMIFISAIVSSIISKNFTKPITELSNITSKMSNLDFSEKFEVLDYDDEISELGNNINVMSIKLETTINQLRKNNTQLEKDIEEKAKIDEMRKQFISDVSHELKTPIGLIQGYAEGLIENVNEDDESRKFYAEVIVDEASKMDKMVKELLELMKLEYHERQLEDVKLDLNELINEEIKRESLVTKEKDLKVIFDDKGKQIIKADPKYVAQVIQNYMTNAIKNCEEVDGQKYIEIRTEVIKNNKVRLFVFNTGKKIPDEIIDKIWGRFYKIDSARTRENGGTGIGLALVKAIMNLYDNDFGAKNLKNGVQFYCDWNI